ncbi:MAG: DNA alkylation repair protein [Rubrivivax sp.]|nr:DNA alkylation repair protein [Rubrivivax sp.]
MAADFALVDALKATLAAHGDAARAVPMQAYMKSALPFHGVATPLRRQLVARAAAAWAPADAATVSDTVLALWRSATHREARYAALDLLRLPRLRRRLSTALLPALQEMIETGAWWDFCDEISGVALARLLQAEPAVMKPVLRRWANGPSMWLRRAAMLSQRSLKSGFDAVLFYDTLLPSLAGGAFADEFFIRKGMGWALRERAHVAPDEVRAFCTEYAERLSPLTKREALRVIGYRTSSAAPASRAHRAAPAAPPGPGRARRPRRAASR